MGDTTDKTSKSDELLFDYTGLKCPLPVLKTRRALGAMALGDIITILADDPAAPLDFVHFCETAGHQLIETAQTGDQFKFRIQKQG